MDWLSSFDPAAARGSSATGTRDAQRPESAASRACPSSAISPTSVQQQTSQSFRRPHQPTTLAIGPSALTRPPHRVAAAPPSAALRLEDSQPNEHQRRAKPWEISAPPTIGSSKVNKHEPHRSVSTCAIPRSHAQQLPQKRTADQRLQQQQQQQQRQRQMPCLRQAEAKQLSKKQRKNLRQQQALLSSTFSPSEAASKKIRLDAKASTETRLPSEHPVSITVQDVDPEILLWTRASRETAERKIASLAPDSGRSSTIKQVREELRGIKEQEVGSARTDKHVRARLKDPCNYINSLCLALRNHSDLLLRLLQIRVELYRCIGMVMQRASAQTDARKYASNLVKRLRDVLFEKLHLGLNSAIASRFCSKEQMLRPTDPILIDDLDQLQVGDDIGRYALAVLSNYLHLFGPRILFLTWCDVEEWKRRNGLFEPNRDGVSEVHKDGGDPRTESLSKATSNLAPKNAEPGVPHPAEKAMEAARTPTLPPSDPSESVAALDHCASDPSQEQTPVKPSQERRSSALCPLELKPSSGVQSIVRKGPTVKEEPDRGDTDMLDEARRAEEFAHYLEELSDAGIVQLDSDAEDHDDNRPLTDPSRTGDGHGAQDRRQTSIESDAEEDIPLQDLLGRRSSAQAAAIGPLTGGNAGSTWPSEPFQPDILGLTQSCSFSGARGLSIRYFVPLASTAAETKSCVRNRASAFDAAIAVSGHGRVATFSEQDTLQPLAGNDTIPRKMLAFQAYDVKGKIKGEKGSWAIDRVEDASRLTSKVCGIVSSTRKVLGIGNYDEYPCQVSLVTVDETGRRHRTYHLEERPHPHGAASISHFPRTNPGEASAIDFATGGIDGIVNHWHWRAKSTKAETHRLHTLHDAKPVVALEHLSSRSNTLASASIGTVVGFDLGALTLGFSWNTSDRIVHLQRTPDPKLMLGVLARRDYDQFRMFDITGRNGPVSRPAISFGWLNDSEGKLPLGRGTFHPTRRAIFAHGAEDGHVRVWDLRNARDPLIDLRIGDEPIVQTIWASSRADNDDDILYAASARGVRSISLLAP